MKSGPCFNRNASSPSVFAGSMTMLPAKWGFPKRFRWGERAASTASTQPMRLTAR